MLWFKIVLTVFLAFDIIFYAKLYKELKNNNVHAIDVLIHTFLIVGVWVWL